MDQISFHNTGSNEPIKSFLESRIRLLDRKIRVLEDRSKINNILVMGRPKVEAPELLVNWKVTEKNFENNSIYGGNALISHHTSLESYIVKIDVILLCGGAIHSQKTKELYTKVNIAGNYGYEYRINNFNISRQSDCVSTEVLESYEINCPAGREISVDASIDLDMNIAGSYIDRLCVSGSNNPIDPRRNSGCISSKNQSGKINEESNKVRDEIIELKKQRKEVKEKLENHKLESHRPKSIVDFLKSRGIDSSFTSREYIAKGLAEARRENEHYTGTHEQNIRMINILSFFDSGSINKFMHRGRLISVAEKDQWEIVDKKSHKKDTFIEKLISQFINDNSKKDEKLEIKVLESQAQDIVEEFEAKEMELSNGIKITIDPKQIKDWDRF